MSLPQEAPQRRPPGGRRTVSQETMNEPKQNQAGRRERRHHDETYKRHAVALTLEGSRSIRQVAAELGVSDSMLYEWRRLYAPRPPVAGPAPGSLADAQQEVARLRAEVLRLREREIILKKSLGILSEPPASGMPGSTR